MIKHVVKAFTLARLHTYPLSLFHCTPFDEAENTRHRVRITELLTACFTGSDLTKQANPMLIKHEQSYCIQTGQTGGLLCSDTSPYKVSEYSLLSPSPHTPFDEVSPPSCDQSYKGSMIVNYDSRVVIWLYFQVRYDSRVVIYDCSAFIRLTTAHQVVLIKLKPELGTCEGD